MDQAIQGGSVSKMPAARPRGRARPGRVALLWVVCTALYIVQIVLFPGQTSGAASPVLYMSGTQVLAGLLAGWALGLRSSTLRIVEVLLQITILYVIGFLATEFLFPPVLENAIGPWLGTIPFLAVLAFLWFGFRPRSKKRRLAAILLFFAANVVGVAFFQSDPWFSQASAAARSRLHPQQPEAEDHASDPMRGIAADRLWEAQPALLKSALDALQPRVPGRSNVYAVAVAAGGAQQLFSREARLARQVGAARFGDSYRGGVLLSNAADDLLRTPLATRGAMAAVARGVAGRMERGRDLAFVYLASHGSREAELSTDLPSYDALDRISAASVADALARAGVERRVIVVSACFAGSWIPALANDDTIVITAARRDRTSFGCDDTRRLTYFGQAFLEGPLAHGASLRDGFEAARKTVAGWEAREKLTPSEPQAYVGKAMQAVWTEPGASPRLRDPRPRE